MSIESSIYKVSCVYLEVTVHICGNFLADYIALVKNNCKVDCTRRGQVELGRYVIAK